MKITAIILTYNQPDALRVIFNSILKQKSLPAEVIIADDGSDKETKKVISEYQKIFPIGLKHVWHEDKGFRGAAIRNKAIRESEGDYLFFSDGDLLFHPCFFSDLEKNVNPVTALIGSRVFLKKEATEAVFANKTFKKITFFSEKIEKNRLNAIRILGLSKRLFYTEFSPKLRGGLLCVAKNELFAVNGWNEDFNGWGKEDTELVARLSFNGIKLKKMKFAGITYHLWHPFLSREMVKKNEGLLTDTILNKRNWCPNGLIKAKEP